MDDAAGFKYRAFISYSHADTAWAKWLHRRLESFKIDADLRGRETPRGPVPEHLRPVFRDRDDFTAGHALTEQTLAALDASAALIVLCSPAAAKSKYVAEEVRLFKSRHPRRPVIPLIVGGKPDDPDRECFPASLKFKLDDDGQVTGKALELLAADPREEGDGKTLALAKVVAGLLGVSSDEIFRRAERERRRQTRLSIGLAAVLAGAIGLAGLFAYFDHQKRQTLADIEGLVAKYSLVGSAQAAEQPGRQSLTEAITAIAEGAARDPRYAEALDLLKEGKPEEAEPLLAAVAADKAARLEQDKKEAAGAYRTLGAIAGLGDPSRARDAYGKALAIDPDDTEAAYWHGYLALLAGDLHTAESALLRLQSLSASDRDLYRAHLRLGEVALAKGALDTARRHQETALGIAVKQSATHPDDPDWQRDLWASHDKMGDLSRVHGDIADALRRYRTGVSITETLVEADPSNPERERDLSTAYIKRGDGQRAFGDFEAALESYRAAQVIRARLAEDGAPGRQRDVSVVRERIGDVRFAQNDRDGAREIYQATLAIRQSLIEQDPGNAGWQRDLSVSEEKLGDLLHAQGDFVRALPHYEASLALRVRLAERDPEDARRQRDLSVAHNKIGDVRKAQGHLAAARDEYEIARLIRERLAEREPENANRRTDLALSYARLAQIHVAQGDRGEALRLFLTGRALIAPLAAQSGNARWLGHVERFDADIARLQKAGVED